MKKLQKDIVIKNLLGEGSLLKKDLSKTDYHIHTEFSDGESSIEDYAKAADKMGFEEIAITDHVWKTSDWLDEYIEEIDKLNKRYKVNILSGCEAKIIDLESGDIDWDGQAQLDFVMGAVHNHLFADGSQPALDEAVMSLKLIRNGDVLVLAHPARNYHRFYQSEGSKYSETYLMEIVKQAVAHNTFIDYNYKLPDYILGLLRKFANQFGATLVFGSDSHNVSEFEDIAKEVYSCQK